jgi:hypothetical protein
MTSKWQAEESEGIRSCDYMHAAPNVVKLSHSLRRQRRPAHAHARREHVRGAKAGTHTNAKQHEVKQHRGFLKEPCAGHRTNRNTSPNAPDPNKDPRLMAERGSSPEVIICVLVQHAVQTQQGH